MMVTHILKDGTVVRDIAGHVVKIEDAKSLYALMDSINNQKRMKANVRKQ